MNIRDIRTYYDTEEIAMQPSCIKIFDVTTTAIETEMNHWLKQHSNLRIRNIGVSRSDDNYGKYYLGYIVYKC